MLAHARRDEGRRQGAREHSSAVSGASLLSDQVHCNGKFVLAELALRVDICKIPDLGQDFLG